MSGVPNQESERFLRDADDAGEIRLMRAHECLEEVWRGIGPAGKGRPLYGASRSGLTPAKEAIGKNPERYKAIEPGTVFYNPMRILLGSIAMLDDGGAPGITSPDYVVVRGRPGVLHHRVFYYWLRSPDGETLIRTLARGGVRERILFNRLCEGRIPVLPWRVQQRLAEQLATIPRARVAAAERLAAARALTAAYLREILDEANRNSPRGTLRDGLRAIEAGTSVQSLERPARDGEWGVLKVSAVSWGTFKRDQNKAVPKDYVPKPHEQVRCGDVLISRANTAELAGAVVVVREAPARLMLSDKTLRLVLREDVLDAHYLELAMRTRAVRRFIEGNATGTSHSMRNISQHTIRATPVPLPPLADQRRIVGELSRRLAEAERLADRIREELEAIEALPAALLREAFSSAAIEIAGDEIDGALSQGGIVSKPGNFFRRGAIATYIVNRLHMVQSFGRVHFEKNLYLTEAFVGIDLGGKYRRKAAGPLDSDFLYKLESIAGKRHWFTKHKRGAEGFFYRPGDAMEDRLRAADFILGARRDRMDTLLHLTSKMDTEQIEIVATLFAAWNDFLIAGEAVSDDLIIEDVRDHWNVSKQKFSSERLATALKWMRDKGLVPNGIGPQTIRAGAA